MTAEDLFTWAASGSQAVETSSEAVTDVESGRASRSAEARAAKMANRQRSTVRCSMCGSYHYRDQGPEWPRPCRLCGIRHGGYCSPFHGATPADWP